MEIEPGKSKYGTGTWIRLDGNEVAVAIDEWLERKGVLVKGPRTIRLEEPEFGACTGGAAVYVDSSGTVTQEEGPTAQHALKIGVVGVIQQGDGILLKGNGGFLLGRRLKPDCNYGKLVFPGGLLEGTESVEDCLRRELLEETGLDVVPIKTLAAFRVPHWGNNLILAVYGHPRSFLQTQEPRNSDELTDLRYYTAQELKDMPEDRLGPTEHVIIRGIVRGYL